MTLQPRSCVLLCFVSHAAVGRRGSAVWLFQQNFSKFMSDLANDFCLSSWPKFQALKTHVPPPRLDEISRNELFRCAAF